jgi:hypothetical protein
MNKFWQRLKNLPWQELSLVALISTLTVAAVEILLVLAITHVPEVRDVLRLILASPFFAVLIPIGVAVGMGALGVYLLEWWQKQWLLNNSSLWALVFCLVVGLLLKSWLPLPPLLIAMSRTTLIGMALGVFWKGRPYWRR